MARGAVLRYREVMEELDMTNDKTVKLSDGSPWTYRVDWVGARWVYGDNGNGFGAGQREPRLIGVTGPLTPADHRAIADVLEPPLGVCPTCGENIYHDDN